MKYSVAKISTTVRNSYEYNLDYPTWKSMMRDLDRRLRYANEVFTGHGSNILRDGVVIGHTKTLELADQPIARITLSQFQSWEG